MRHLFNYSLLLSIFFISACSTKKDFVKENVCSPNALTYINRSKGRSMNVPKSSELRAKLTETQKDMQTCYNNYLMRTGKAEFQTCMVVGVDSRGRVEYYNFSSQDIHSDPGFIQCAAKVTKRVPYSKYGKNFILVQSYNFYQ